jgi:FkbM family methyltransferase
VKLLFKISRDFWGLIGIAGSYPAVKWLILVVFKIPEILRCGDMQPADRASGAGPSAVQARHCRDNFIITGVGAFSGIRAMHVREAYLHDGWLTIEDGDIVVDLGANIGNFTKLALAHGDSVRVISVEPGCELTDAFESSVGQNFGFLDRTQRVRAFLGGATGKQDAAMLDQQYRDDKWLSEDELIDIAKISRVDFLKRDIEGGELALFHSMIKLLRMARKMSIEIYKVGCEVDGFIVLMEAQGFKQKEYLLGQRWKNKRPCCPRVIAVRF